MFKRLSIPFSLCLFMAISACGSRDEALNPDWVSRANSVSTLGLIDTNSSQQILLSAYYFLGNNDTSDDSTQTNHISGSAVLPEGKEVVNTNISVIYRNMATRPNYTPGTSTGFIVAHTCDIYKLGWASAPYYYSLENIEVNYNAASHSVEYGLDLIHTAYYWRYAYVQIAVNLADSSLGKVIATDLHDGSIRFSITVPEKKDVVHFFAKRNGVQDFDAINVQLVGEIANADGTYTYQTVRPAAYQQGDVVTARCFTYTPASGQIFYPGPAENTWSDPLTIVWGQPK